MSGKRKLKIVIPVEDWEEEYLREEIDVSTEDAIIATRLGSDVSAQQLGRAVVVARERGETKAGIIPPNKILLNIAASLEARLILTRQREEVETPSGRTYDAPAFIGPVYAPSDEPSGAKPFVTLTDPKALALALAYLERAVPGHIWNRLLIVAANDGDIVAAAQIVHDKVDEMVGRLVEANGGV